MEYYTYAFLREDGTPYYIGKGKGYRIHDKKGRPCNLPPKERIIKLKQNLTEEEAFRHEKYMISVFGRKDLGTGILHNKTDGGEGTSGLVHKEQSKIKMATCRDTKYWNNGIKNVRAKECPGEGWILGKLNNKQNSFRKGLYWWNNGEELKVSKECPGEGWVRGFGKLINKKGCGKKHNEEGFTTKGLCWWNDGHSNKMHKECPGEGWVRGKIPLMSEEERKKRHNEKCREYYYKNREKILQQKRTTLQ